jgi:DNA-directed RNA polymerase subunit RPC12/RpoP
MHAAVSLMRAAVERLPDAVPCFECGKSCGDDETIMLLGGKYRSGCATCSAKYEDDEEDEERMDDEVGDRRYQEWKDREGP